MEYLIYISTAKHLLDNDELIDICTVSQSRNRLHGITGVLLYSDGTFIQLLEGETNDVELVFSSITNDNRHKNIIKLAHDPISYRAFPDWTMGFKTLKPEEMKELEGYFNPAERSFDGMGDHPGLEVIKTFVQSH